MTRTITVKCDDDKWDTICDAILKSGGHISGLKETELYWKAAVKAWFDYYSKEKGTDPSFTNGEQPALKRLVGKIKKKAVDAGIQWTEESSVASLNIFFEKVRTCNPWVYEHLSLKNIDNQFDIIYAKARSKTAGSQERKLDEAIKARFGVGQQGV